MMVDKLTVSRAMARGRPGMVLADSRALSMTDWWYCKILLSVILVNCGTRNFVVR